MADEVISNLRTTIKSVAYDTSDENLHSPLQINVHQCKLLARNASETSKVLDNFLKVLHDRELQSKIKNGHHVSDDDIPNWIPAAQELLRVLRGGEALIKACCCGNGGQWLQVAIQQGDMKETFAKFLYDIQWHMSLLCSMLVTAREDFEPTACEGSLDMSVYFTLLIAAKQDGEELERQLKGLKGDHDCAGNDLHDESECKKYLGGEQCLAAKLLEKMTAKDQLEGIGRKSLSSTSPHFLWVNPHELQKGKQLGIGAFAKVRETTWLGNKFAHKIFTQAHEPSFKQELAALAGLSHPHVVHVKCCSEGGKGHGSEEKLGIIMELMHKSLFDLLKEYRLRNCTNTTMDAPPFTHTQAVDLMLQIAEGVRYIHKQGLVHRDLKSLNILVQFAYPAQITTTTTTTIMPAATDDAPLIAKIADFGLTKWKNLSTRYSHLTLDTGTSKWMAPEIFSLEIGEEPPSRCQPWRMDVYSFGIVCYELLSGQEPYQDQPWGIRPRVKAGERPKLPKDVPTRLAVLIQRCWDGNAYRRPDFSKICTELRYIKGILLRGERPTLDQRKEVPGFHLEGATVQGPWGGRGGVQFFDGLVTFIKQIKLKYDVRNIWYFEVEYEINGVPFTAGHGDVSSRAKTTMIEIREPGEYLAQIKGTYGITPGTSGPNYTSVRSLTICTNYKEYGPFGGQGETPFQSDCGRIVGFHGRSGTLLDQIGCFIYLGEN